MYSSGRIHLIFNEYDHILLTIYSSNLWRFPPPKMLTLISAYDEIRNCREKGPFGRMTIFRYCGCCTGRLCDPLTQSRLAMRPPRHEDEATASDGGQSRQQVYAGFSQRAVPSQSYRFLRLLKRLLSINPIALFRQGGFALSLLIHIWCFGVSFESDLSPQDTLVTLSHEASGCIGDVCSGHTMASLLDEPASHTEEVPESRFSLPGPKLYGSRSVIIVNSQRYGSQPGCFHLYLLYSQGSITLFVLVRCLPWAFVTKFFIKKAC